MLLISFLTILQIFFVYFAILFFKEFTPLSSLHETVKETATNVNWSTFLDTNAFVGFFLITLLIPFILIICILIKYFSGLNKDQRSDIAFLAITSISVIVIFLSALATFPKESFEFFSTVLSTLLIVLGFIQLIISSLRKTTFKDFGKQEEPKAILKESTDATKKYMPRRKFH